MFGVIGGSGLARLADLSHTRRQVMRTPYGDPSGALTFGQLDGVDVCFLARHGYGHTLAPHEINYRANIWALREVGVKEMIAVASVGAISEKLHLGSLILPDQLLDYTYGRKGTFFEGGETPVRHVDFTLPYDQALRTAIERSAEQLKLSIFPRGVYACTQGPRLETAAEIQRMARDGATLVGMTGMPEAVLARELELPYAAIAVVANHAAGIGSSVSGISVEAMGPVLDHAMSQVRLLLAKTIASLRAK